MGEDGDSSYNTELASRSVDDYELLDIDVLEHLDSDELQALRTYFYPAERAKKQKPKQPAATDSKFSGVPLKKDKFIKAIETVTGNSIYSLSAAKLFQILDIEKQGVIWWEQLLDHLIDKIGQRDEEKAFMQPIDTNVTVHNASHCKRECIIKIVPIETASTFCYAVLSKFGRVGVYDGQLQLCENYIVRLAGNGGGDLTQEDEIRRRVTSTWIADALYLPDAAVLLMVASDRTMHIFETTSLVHTPLCYVSGMKNSPQCLAYAPSIPGHPSMLFIGDDKGNITMMKFHQPKISLFRKKHPDKLDKYYWVEIETQSEYVSISVERSVHADTVRQITYCPDNETVVSCSQDPAATVVIRHILGRRSPYIFKLGRGVRCFHIDRSLKLLATGSNDGVVRLWNPVVTKQPTVSLFGHKTAIVDVLILHLMSSVISCSANGVVKVWDIDDQCCLQTLQISFPSFSILGKAIEFGSHSIYPGPPNRSISSRQSSMNSLSETGAADNYQQWSSLQLLVACCNHIAVLNLTPRGIHRAAPSSPLPPPSREHRASVPSPWQTSAVQGIITPDSLVYDQNESNPPWTSPPPEILKEIEEEQGELEIPLNFCQPLSQLVSKGPAHNLNMRRTLQDRRTKEMHMLLERCAPHLALELQDLHEIRFSRPLPITTRMREQGIDVSDPDHLLSISAPGSTTASSLGSARSSSRHLTPEWTPSKSSK